MAEVYIIYGYVHSSAIPPRPVDGGKCCRYCGFIQYVDLKCYLVTDEFLKLGHRIFHPVERKTSFSVGSETSRQV